MLILTYPEIVSTLALLISLASFGVAAYNAFRDRPHLRVSSEFYEESEWGSARIVVIAVNAGRRPVILRILTGQCEDGSSSGEYLGDEGKGLRLGEHERFEKTLEKQETVVMDPERVGPDPPFVRMWIEDSLGNRHVVPKSQEQLRKLWVKPSD